MNLTEDTKTILKMNLIIFAVLIAIPALLFYPLKGSININVYTSAFKYLCLLGPIAMITFAIQCAKSEEHSKEFLIPTVVGGALFMAILAPSSGDSAVTSKVFITSIFAVFILGISIVTEMIRFKLIARDTKGSSASQLLSVIVPAAVAGIGYLYDTDLLDKDRISTHWFAYIGLGISLYFSDAAFQYFRENFTEFQTKKNTSIFVIMNVFFWYFFSVLFILV